jgi:hypothetical protein
MIPIFLSYTTRRARARIASKRSGASSRAIVRISPMCIRAFTTTHGRLPQPTDNVRRLATLRKGLQGACHALFAARLPLYRIRSIHHHSIALNANALTTSTMIVNTNHGHSSFQRIKLSVHLARYTYRNLTIEGLMRHWYPTLNTLLTRYIHR